MKLLLPLIIIFNSSPSIAWDNDPATGLINKPGMELVRAHCTACHSARLIIQNKAERPGWLSTIRWMQESQGLWPLGQVEATILDYLSANYGPKKVGRRKRPPPELLPP
ncbi:MAG: hypothetical protein CMK43_08890 [Porticoccaceae bacterium]|nr:hypothetical protein [Porticoccaceae bacterium]